MDFKTLLKKIKEYNTIIIHGHINPDGDCYGSQFGLKQLIKDNFKDKEVYVVGGTTAYVAFLGTPDIIEDSKYDNALCICVDTGNKDRISDQRFFTGKETIKVDHHIPIDSYAQTNIVDEFIPACAQIIAMFAFESKLTVSKEAAFALYTGIVTDTGRYRHGIVPSTFEISAKLINCGVDAKELDNLLSVESLNVLKLKGYVLSNFVVADEGLAFVKIPKEILKQYDVTYEEGSNQVGVIGTIESCPVWCLFIEDQGQIRGRLRSRGPELDILANKYGGGGHKMACGVKFDKWEDVNPIIEDLKKLVKDYKGN